MTGAPRLEKLGNLAAQAEPGPCAATAVINLKRPPSAFVEDRLRGWLQAAVEAARSNGLKPLISKHFLSFHVDGDLEVFDGRIEEAILLSRILISPPSTTVFEAMVLGRQPFLFVSEDDMLCEFHDPCGAFPVCWIGDELSSAIQAYLAGEVSFAHAPFLAGIHDRDAENSASDRIAQAVLTHLT